LPSFALQPAGVLELSLETHPRSAETGIYVADERGAGTGSFYGALRQTRNPEQGKSFAA